MKNKTTVLLSVLLILAIGNYMRIVSTGNIRTVEFLSIFIIGVLSGILGLQIFRRNKS